MQHSTRNQPVQPYNMEGCFSHGNSNCRNSLQKHLGMNKSSDELYERIRSPITQPEDSLFIYPEANFDYRMASRIYNGDPSHQNVDGNCDTAEAVTRFDQDNSADSDPESYLHSNSDLEENKNNSCTSVENNQDIST